MCFVRQQISEKSNAIFVPLMTTSAFEAFVLHAMTSATTPVEFLVSNLSRLSGQRHRWHRHYPVSHVSTAFIECDKASTPWEFHHTGP